MSVKFSLDFYVMTYLPFTTRGFPLLPTFMLDSCLQPWPVRERSLPSSKYSTVERVPSREFKPPTTMIP